MNGDWLTLGLNKDACTDKHERWKFKVFVITAKIKITRRTFEYKLCLYSVPISEFQNKHFSISVFI